MAASLLQVLLGAFPYLGTTLAITPRSLSASAASVPLDLTSFYNNKGIGTYPGEAAFDRSNQSYPNPGFQTPYYTSPDTGILYSLPGYTGPRKPDNVISSGQTIPVTPGSYFSASFLSSSDVQGGTISANVTFQYSDGSSSLFELRSLNWFSTLTIDRGLIIFPHRFTNQSVNGNTSHIFETTAALNPNKSLTSIVLPTVSGTPRLHLFAISLWKGSSVGVQTVRPTQKWIGDGIQIVEVTLNNAGLECVAGPGLAVSLEGHGFKTVEVGYVKRLCPGDQKIAHVGVRGTIAKADVHVAVKHGPLGQASFSFTNIDIGLETWTSDRSSISKHEAPQWFDDSKFGIFIHWGPYAVTGWGNSSPYESYAEWFWWYSTHHPQADRSDFYDYRLRTYGKEWAYDDTFPDFNASNFDAKAWVDLFTDAGAKYFVITSKHHDGFAIFDAGATSNRSSLHYGPKRDILKELFDASAKYQPSLKRGTYFSLPEWFNPDFGPYGFDSSTSPSTVSWPGILATNPYTGVTEPYTGHVPVGDFITDLMVPQMEILAYDYNVDIMWCDCGQANGTAEFAANWWNKASEQNRQVTINSRCGIPEAADFDTPEYETFSSAQRRKWESNMGMDPYSYGYNRATAPEEYMTATEIVYSLVDMVSKNGNFLLDIGPRADGTIVEAEADNLRAAGKWIKSHGEAIFNTTYWFIQSQIVSGMDVRFTQSDDAFYIIFLSKPVPTDGVLAIKAPIPIVEGDAVSLLAVSGGEKLTWKSSGFGDDKILSIEVPKDLLDQDEYGWVFRIQYAS
ncbi:alpha-L-fucosidase [Thozetella sp. PMI_491]|nr:alpha-L-fucosidase [Thozetella sp. PMI_491]